MSNTDTLKKMHAAIKKMGLGSAIASVTPEPMDVISSGSLTLDKTLGVGGWARGRLMEIFGPESVGKTTLAIAACVEAQRQGGFVCYLDFEHAIDLNYAQNIGLDLSPEKFAFFQPNCFEDGAAIAQMFCQPENIQASIIVIDSVAAMMPKKIYEAGPGEESKQPGMMASLMSPFLSKMTKLISESNTLLLLINQVRSNIKLSAYDSGPDEITTGGNAIKFYCSVRLQLKPSMVEKANVLNVMTGVSEPLAVSNFVKVITVKNKLARGKMTAEFVIRYGEGIDNIRSIMKIAEMHGILKKSGAWFSFGKEDDPMYLKAHGVEQMRSLLREEKNSHILKRMAELVQDKFSTNMVGKITAAISDDDITTVNTSMTDTTPLDFDD